MNTRQLILSSMFALLVTGLLAANFAYAAKLEVLAAVPPDTEAPAEAPKQLPVKIIGGGFDRGTKATFLVAGSKSNTGGITVIKTEFVSDTELTATIEVAVEVTIGDFDIQVQTSRGRRGKGNTLFAVKQKNGGGGSNVKGYAVKVTFDDLPGDTMKSDGNPSYFDFEGSGAGAAMPVEFSPPGQFRMWLKAAAIRHFFFDFGEAVDCAGADPGTLACVFDKADDSTFTDPVPCLFPIGERFDDLGAPADTWCSGFKLGAVAFRHTVDDSGAELEYMLGMTNGVTFDGEGDNIEIELREESRKEDNLRIRYDANCLGQNVGDFLKITAWDNVVGDGIPNDEWKIDTIETDDERNIITTTKTACLTRKGNGKREDIVGLFDMQFGYAICILDNQEPASASDGACLWEP